MLLRAGFCSTLITALCREVLVRFFLGLSSVHIEFHLFDNLIIFLRTYSRNPTHLVEVILVLNLLVSFGCHRGSAEHLGIKIKFLFSAWLLLGRCFHHASIGGASCFIASRHNVHSPTTRLSQSSITLKTFCSPR